MREWEPLWRAKLPEIDELFEVVVDSAFVGLRKPDPAIYELTLERLGDGVQAERLRLRRRPRGQLRGRARARDDAPCASWTPAQAIPEIESALAE